jgi:hypothetical protein
VCVCVYVCVYVCVCVCVFGVRLCVCVCVCVCVSHKCRGNVTRVLQGCRRGVVTEKARPTVDGRLDCS